MNQNAQFASSNAWAVAIIAWQLAFTAGAIDLSLSGSPLFWVLGEVLLAISMFQWFVLHHDLAHGGFFRTKALNVVVGHLSSLFCLIPFNSWRQVHHHHHRWSGWKDKDPSDPHSQVKKLPRWLIRLVDFCWKFWVPTIALSFVVINFWNLRRVNQLFPDRKSRARNLFSVLFLATAFVAAFAVFGRVMLTAWLPAFVLFLMLSDPILLTQHAHIDANYARGQRVKAFRYSQQGAFARNVIYPRWIAKYFFYNSERHGLHHAHPEIPIYRLGRLPSPSENQITFGDWLRTAKAMPAELLIFKTTKESGIRL